ncbi:uncharacterized protein VTP21DRAFT_4983 [Calcarisporiella thermophila]|uniref:uncharacterized protein n=1 Tax=Calcarisporiella thermophila TaxID=911321 RepID=UPI003743FB83
MANLFHIILYHIIHFFYSIHLSVTRAWSWATQYINERIASPPSCQIIHHDLAPLPKKPHHLTVVLPRLESEQQLGDTIRDIAMLACWCVEARIAFLSIYESSGKIKHEIDAITKEIARLKIKWFGEEDKHQVKVGAMSLLNGVKYVNGLKPTNGKYSTLHQYSPDLNVILLSHEDGYRHVVEATKSICQSVNHGDIAEKEISMELVDDRISASFSEPNLMIVLSNTRWPDQPLRLYGYPPWHIRLTEIIHVAAPRISYRVFRNALYRYARVEQRFGR